jgi:hypothetical protein
MSLAVRSIIKILVFISASFILCSCKTLREGITPPEELVKKQSRQKIFLAAYDDVWRAAHTALKYPIANENQDTGVIETDFIKSQDGFIPPETKAPSSGLRYKIFMYFAKGRTQGKESVRVTVDKRIEKLRDFFSDAETLSSDGLEEKLLFYRIERELLIMKGLKKALQEDTEANEAF